MQDRRLPVQTRIITHFMWGMRIIGTGFGRGASGMTLSAGRLTERRPDRMLIQGCLSVMEASADVWQSGATGQVHNRASWHLSNILADRFRQNLPRGGADTKSPARSYWGRPRGA